MKVRIESLLPCFQETVWEEVQKFELLQEVAYPLLTFRLADGEAAPDWWQAGESVAVNLYAFNRIPLGKHTLTVERVDAEAHEIRSREHNAFIHRWDHRIQVQYVAEDLTRYVDEVEIDAGLLTFPIWLFAQWFYRHRHRRWQQIADRICEADRPTADDLPETEIPEREK